ncbi:MAG: hypothetical protein WCT54_01650 [Patescibacteria group bacterium]|jgi:hypothetical protein
MKSRSSSLFAGFDTMVGWFGIGAILLAYTLLTFGVLKSNDLTYMILNLVGSIGILIISFAKKAYQPAVLNIIWSVVALIALVRLFV